MSCKQNRHTIKKECPHCNFIFIMMNNVDVDKICPSCGRQISLGPNFSDISRKVMQSNDLTLGHNANIHHIRDYSGCPTRYHGGNNVYYKDGCPALMDDGRFITYYNSSNELTETLRKLNGFNSSNQFRTFMQVNADLFMNSEREFAIRQNTCSPKTACSEGWYDLWTDYNGCWANDPKINQIA